MKHQVYEERHPTYEVNCEKSTNIFLRSSRKMSFGDRVCNIIETPIMTYHVSQESDYLVGMPTSMGSGAPIVLDMGDFANLHEFIEWLVENDEVENAELIYVNLL